MADDEERLDLSATERRVLLAPEWVARAAAAAAPDAEQRWMLRLPRDVRRAFVAEVLDRGAGRREAQERWLLLAGDDVRRSYVEEVLGQHDHPPKGEHGHP